MVNLNTHKIDALEKKRKKTKKIVVGILGLAILIAMGIGLYLYKVVMSSNVDLGKRTEASLFIPTNADFQTVKDSLYKNNIIVHHKSFEWMAGKMNYKENVKPGRYLIKEGTSNIRLINMLIKGHQTPVRLTFNNMRNVNQLSARVAQQIEADSLSIRALLSDDTYLAQLGFDEQTIPSMFLPNTYEFYWNTDANAFISKMMQEYHKFWNTENTAKAQKKGLTPIEVSILASIVDKETNKTDEMPRIAGVYLNRLNSNWPLQADPTLVFAWGDFSIRRVLSVHKEIDSPYNTYKNTGLPPGPICIPSLAAINAVLNAETHNYYYFCAREDMSGYHNFAKTHDEHIRNADKYRKALNKLNIWN